jgi:hypothetical protein
MRNQNDMIVLEPSTNTHRMLGRNRSVAHLTELNGMSITNEGPAIVLHGEHGVICTESKHIVKAIQQEYNPVTQMLQNSFD